MSFLQEKVGRKVADHIKVDFIPVRGGSMKQGEQ